MPPPRGFLRSCAVAFVVGIGRGREVSGANVYDTKTPEAIRLTCDPVPAKCDIGESPFNLYSSMIYPVGDITGNPADGGVIRFDSLAAYFVAGGCKPDQNCTALCDGTCACATGSIGMFNGHPTGFVPDGGLCDILDTTPGDVPSDAPTAVPTVAPTFDGAAAILYDFTGLTQPSVMRISDCVTYGHSLESVCELRSGNFRFQVTSPSYYGVSDCDEGDTCILACSTACSCDVQTGEETNKTYSFETKNCTVVAPTDSPSPSPTKPPTESPPSSAVAKALGLAAGVAFGGFFMLGTA